MSIFKKILALNPLERKARKEKLEELMKIKEGKNNRDNYYSFREEEILEHNEEEKYFIVQTKEQKLHDIKTKYDYARLENRFDSRSCIVSHVGEILYDVRHGYGKLTKTDDLYEIDITYHNKEGSAVSFYYLSGKKDPHHLYFLHGNPAEEKIFNFYKDNKQDLDLFDNELSEEFVVLRKLAFPAFANK